MKFTVAGSRIFCSRKDNTAADDDVHRRVVEFDAHVDSVPPHVAAKLTTGEVEQLKKFIADRKRIQANPVETNVLEALPGLLQEATDVLGTVERVDKTMYRKLSESIVVLNDALDKVRPAPRGGLTPVESMRHSEAQKERLESIKQEL